MKPVEELVQLCSEQGFTIASCDILDGNKRKIGPCRTFYRRRVWGRFESMCEIDGGTYPTIDGC